MTVQDDAVPQRRAVIASPSLLSPPAEGFGAMAAIHHSAPPLLGASAAVRERMTLLRHKGFRQSLKIDKHTGFVLVEWALVWAGVREAVVASAEDAAIAYRIPDVGFDATDPTFLPPGQALWQWRGLFSETVDLLLSQPSVRSHFPGRADSDSVHSTG